MKTSLFLAAALVAAALPATAFAQGESRSAAVAYKDLDLASAAGRQSLDTRLGGAVERVCGRPGNVGLVEAAENRRCLRETRAVALALARLAVARAGMSDAAFAAR